MACKPVPLKKDGAAELPIRPFIHSAHIARLFAQDGIRRTERGYEVALERQYRVVDSSATPLGTDCPARERVEWRKVWVPVIVDDRVPDGQIWDVLGDWLKFK